MSLLVLLLVIVLLAVCSFFNLSDGTADSTPTQSILESRLAERSSQIEIVQQTSSLSAEASMQELEKYSDLIIVGEVIGASESFLVEPVNGADPKCFTDYYIQVNEVLYGSDLAEEVVTEEGIATVRVEGGIGNSVAYLNDSDPDFLEGGEYLLYLYRIEDGSDYNTEGSHLYLVGECQGAWLADGEASTSLPAGEKEFANFDESESASLANVRSSIGNDAVQHVSAADRKDAYLASLAEEYASGNIAENDYLSYMAEAEAEATSYARIMTDEEAAKYEESTIQVSSGSAS